MNLEASKFTVHYNFDFCILILEFTLMLLFQVILHHLKSPALPRLRRSPFRFTLFSAPCGATDSLLRNPRFLIFTSLIFSFTGKYPISPTPFVGGGAMIAYFTLAPLVQGVYLLKDKQSLPRLQLKRG